MKLIIISGPPASGKDAVVDEIVKQLDAEHPGQVSRSDYTKTRKPRSNEKDSQYFVTKEEFDNLVASGELLPELSAQVADYYVGYKWSEFEKSEIVVVNIDDEKARILKQRVEGQGGKAMTIFLHAPLDTRVIRYRLREGLLFDEPALHRMNNEITDPNPETHTDFDLVVENKEDQFEATMSEIMPKVKEFLNA